MSPKSREEAKGIRLKADGRWQKATETEVPEED